MRVRTESFDLFVLEGDRRKRGEGRRKVSSSSKPFGIGPGFELSRVVGRDELDSVAFPSFYARMGSCEERGRRDSRRS